MSHSDQPATLSERPLRLPSPDRKPGAAQAPWDRGGSRLIEADLGRPDTIQGGAGILAGSHKHADLNDGTAKVLLQTIGVTVAVGIAYFTVARLGLALRTHAGLAIFWPAAGVAIGALITLGSKARLGVAAAVAAASIASSLMIGRVLWLALALSLVNAAQVLLIAWIVERWFGSAFKLEDVGQVLGFLVASAVGAAVGATGAVAAMRVVEPSAFPPVVWRVWFGACLLGTVAVAPLIIGLGDAVRKLPPRQELTEGGVGVAILALLSAILISLPQGPWATAVPVALATPVLLWICVRCAPVFAAGGSLVIATAIIWSTTFNLGHFGDATIPLGDRILAAQTLILVGAMLVSPNGAAVN